MNKAFKTHYRFKPVHLNLVVMQYNYKLLEICYAVMSGKREILI